ncbi:rho guanine nucleotide exchange factor 25-like, partial [Coregonus clupeaformis]|uniref:rho guanine nucleotide exchange factor 25-like n=1 Tax=Coregonus clupeaformis TaxID=59861 RepID=UPI001E1C527F
MPTTGSRSSSARGTPLKGGHHHRGCACQHLFRKVLVKCGCCYARVRDSYSAAGSEGSISTSVASLPPTLTASDSSAPSSPGSRRSVSTLKKWLTNPVRKLSAEAVNVSASAKGERQVKKLDGGSKPPPPIPPSRHSNGLGLGLGRPLAGLGLGRPLAGLGLGRPLGGLGLG